jgi:hypothetical protein
VQGLLALIRVSIWVIDFAFDDLESGSEDVKSGHAKPSRFDVGGQMPLLRLSKLGESILNDPQQSLQDPFTISNWVLDVLDLNDTEICSAFELAHSIYTEGANDEAL